MSWKLCVRAYELGWKPNPMDRSFDSPMNQESARVWLVENERQARTYECHVNPTPMHGQSLFVLRRATNTGMMPDVSVQMPTDIAKDIKEALALSRSLVSPSS